MPVSKEEQARVYAMASGMLYIAEQAFHPLLRQSPIKQLLTGDEASQLKATMELLQRLGHRADKWSKGEFDGA